MSANLENSAVTTGLEKVNFRFNPKERQCQRMFKLLHNCTHSHASKVMLEILQVRLQQYVNQELPDGQVGFRKTRNQRPNCQHPLDHLKSKRVPEKHLLLLYWLCQNLCLCRSQQTGKFFKRWEYQTTLPAPWEIFLQVETTVRTRHGATDWFQIVKGVHQDYILSTCLFNLYSEYITWNARLDEAQAGIKIFGRNINNLRYGDDTTLMAESEELKSLLMKLKEESEKLA